MSLRLATVYHRGDPHGHRHPGHPDRETVIRPRIRREDHQLGDSRGDAGQPEYRAAIVRRAKRLVLDASTIDVAGQEVDVRCEEAEVGDGGGGGALDDARRVTLQTQEAAHIGARRLLGYRWGGCER